MDKYFFAIIDGRELYFTCKSNRAEDRVIQIAELFIDGKKIASGRVHFFNRSWEAFPYQKAMVRAVDNGIKKDEAPGCLYSYRAIIAR